MKPTQIRMLMAALVLTGCASFNHSIAGTRRPTKLSSKSTGLIEGFDISLSPACLSYGFIHLGLSGSMVKVSCGLTIHITKNWDANKGARDGLMKKNRRLGCSNGQKNRLTASQELLATEGPGFAEWFFPNNGGHDPIVYRYGYIKPLEQCV